MTFEIRLTYNHAGNRREPLGGGLIKGMSSVVLARQHILIPIPKNVISYYMRTNGFRKSISERCEE